VIAGPLAGLGDGQPPAKTPAQNRGGARAQAQSDAQLSLGEIARRARADQTRHPTKPAKVYTSENLPSGSGGVTIATLPPPAAAGAAITKHGLAYFSSRMAELQQNLDAHQRDLAVLHQKLGQNMVQFYPDPNKQLQQQYSRSDIDKVNTASTRRNSRSKRIRKLSQTCNRRFGTKAAAPTGSPGVPPRPKPDLAGVEKGSQKYWQLRFEAARKRWIRQTGNRSSRQTN